MSADIKRKKGFDYEQETLSFGHAGLFAGIEFGVWVV
jgi:hypothetical protein